MRFTDEELAVLRQLATERIAQKRAVAEEQKRLAVANQERETAKRKDFEEELRSFYSLTLPDAEAKRLAAASADRLLREVNRAVEQRVEQRVQTGGFERV